MNKGFKDILDSCLDRMIKGDSIEQCLESYPEQAAELETILRAASAVMEASSVQPRHEFERVAKARLLSAVEEKATEKRKGPLPIYGWRRGWAVAIALIMALFLAGGGTVAASSNSLPGDVLYPVKTSVERVRAFFTFGAEAKADYYMELADRRLREMELLVEKKRAVPASLLRAMNTETDRAIRRLRQIDDTNKELISRIERLTTDQKMMLKKMVEEASPETKQKFWEAFQRAERAVDSVREMWQKIPDMERMREIPQLNFSTPKILTPGSAIDDEAGVWRD